MNTTFRQAESFFSDLYFIIFIPLFERSGKVETKYLVRERCKFHFIIVTTL